MAITYHTLPAGNISDAASYQGQLWLMLLQFECKVGGVPDETIYDDGKQDSIPQAAHNPIIGVGFNLHARLLPVMQDYFEQPTFGLNQSDTYVQDKRLIVKLNSIMNEVWSGGAFNV